MWKSIATHFFLEETALFCTLFKNLHTWRNSVILFVLHLAFYTQRDVCELHLRLLPLSWFGIPCFMNMACYLSAFLLFLIFSYHKRGWGVCAGICLLVNVWGELLWGKLKNSGGQDLRKKKLIIILLTCTWNSIFSLWM